MTLESNACTSFRGPSPSPAASPSASPPFVGTDHAPSSSLPPSSVIPSSVSPSSVPPSSVPWTDRSSCGSPSSLTENDPTPTSAAREQRFVPNKIERAWILWQLVAGAAPTQKGKTLEATYALVAANTRERHVTDQVIVQDQDAFGMAWRSSYMATATTANIQYIASIAVKQAKQVVVADEPDYDGMNSDEAQAGVREGGRDGDARHVLDQALLDYKMESLKRVVSSDDTAARTIARRKESRKEKAARLSKRKSDYAMVKKRKEDIKKQRIQEKRAADRYHLAAQTITANAASASVVIASRQCEQFGAFLSLYARKNQLTVPEVCVPLPQFVAPEVLQMDPGLLAPSLSAGPQNNAEQDAQPNSSES